jgi:flavin-dependent dehydrogenase
VAAYESVHRIDRDKARAYLDLSDQKDGHIYNQVGTQGGYSTFTWGVDLDRGLCALLVGIIHPRGWNEAARYERQWAQRLGFLDESICGGGADIPIRHSLDRLVYDGLVIIGDAACLVNPVHGSGMASGLHSARLASRAIIRALGQGSNDTRALWGYAAQYQRTRGAVMAGYGVLSTLVQRFTARQIGQLFNSGLLDINESLQALDCMPMRPSLQSLWIKIQSIPHFPSLALPTAALRSVLVEQIYRQYPQQYNSRQFALWQRLVKLAAGPYLI